MYIQNLSQSQNTFNGGFYLKGSKWPQYLKEKLIKNQGLFDELTAKNDVFVRLKCGTAYSSNLYHTKGDKIYKIIFSKAKEGSKIGQILDKLHLKRRVSLTHNYYTERAIMGRIDSSHANAVISELG